MVIFIHLGITKKSVTKDFVYLISQPVTTKRARKFTFMPMYANIIIIFHRVPDLKLVVMASKDHERTFRLILYIVDF